MYPVISHVSTTPMFAGRSDKSKRTKKPGSKMRVNLRGIIMTRDLPKSWCVKNYASYYKMSFPPNCETRQTSTRLALGAYESLEYRYKESYDYSHIDE